MTSQFERYKYLPLAVVLTAGAAFSHFVASFALTTNGQFGFPLDDPWIHLQFARNLHDYGSFSYFKNEMVTAGSTSPLYTILLAFGFFITSNEMVLSYAYGVLFLAVAGFFFFKLTELGYESKEHDSNGWPIAIGGALLLMLEMRMQWAALSGMETTLFICLLLAVVYFYQSKQSIPLGVFAGLLVWSRPEAVILFIALGVDAAYHRFWVKRARAKKKAEPPPSPEWIKKSLLVLGAFGVVYVGFNFYLSGSVFPNTYAAKLKYYGGGTGRNFPSEVFHFLVDGHMLAIAVLASLSIVTIVLRIIKRQPQAHLVPLTFSVGMFLAYWMKLPFLYQEGRYMMPILPFVILLAIAGLQWVFAERSIIAKLLPTRKSVLVFQLAILAAIALQFEIASWNKRVDYAASCKYINDRQVRAAKWLRDNTPQNAVIGTHDIGAIAFYSQRRVADMVGLVSPEMIDRIGSLQQLRDFLQHSNVTHVAVLRNWFEIVNQTALFKTNERNPEIMEVFAFDAQRTHFTGQNVSNATVTAAQYLYQGQFEIAGQILQQALQLDPDNSKVHHLIGSLFLATGRLDDATREFNIALRLHPEFFESEIGLAQVSARRNKPAEAISQLESIAQRNPDYPTVFRALADVYAQFRLDSAKTNAHMRRFNQLTAAPQ